MPIMEYKARDYTGKRCRVYAQDHWQPALIIGMERVVRIPFLCLAGYAECPILPVRLADGSEIEAGCLAVKFVDEHGELLPDFAEQAVSNG